MNVVWRPYCITSYSRSLLFFTPSNISPCQVQARTRARPCIAFLKTSDMAKKAANSVASTPATLKKSSSSNAQRTLHGFFSKTPTPSTTKSTSQSTIDSVIKPSFSHNSSFSDLTPVPSSDVAEPEEDTIVAQKGTNRSAKGPISSVPTDEKSNGDTDGVTAFGTPSRRV